MDAYDHEFQVALGDYEESIVQEAAIISSIHSLKLIYTSDENVRKKIAGGRVCPEKFTW